MCRSRAVYHLVRVEVLVQFWLKVLRTRAVGGIGATATEAVGEERRPPTHLNRNAPREHDQIGPRQSGSRKLALDGCEQIERVSAPAGVCLPPSLRREADARSVAAATVVGRAEGRRAPPCKIDEQPTPMRAAASPAAGQRPRLQHSQARPKALVGEEIAMAEAEAHGRRHTLRNTPTRSRTCRASHE